MVTHLIMVFVASYLYKIWTSTRDSVFVASVSSKGTGESAHKSSLLASQSTRIDVDGDEGSYQTSSFAGECFRGICAYVLSTESIAQLGPDLQCLIKVLFLCLI